MEILELLSETTLCHHCDHKFLHASFQLEPITTALRASYYPQNSETDRIKTALASIDRHLEVYDPEIARLEKLLGSLETRKAELRRIRACLNSALSPVRALPAEVLQLIFIACMDEDRPDAIPTVGQVCRFWRTVSTGTPELWSNISVGGRRYPHQRYFDLAELFHERSGAWPLRMTVRHGLREDIRAIAFDHTERWRTLRLETPDFDFYASLGLQTREFPKLESLEILRATLNERAPYHPPPVFLPRAPKLRRVILKDPIQRWGLPWKQLTHIQYDIPSVSDGIFLLSKCPALIDCSLDRLLIPPEDDVPVDLPPTLHLRHLQSLRLAVDTTASSGRFNALMAPLLQRLNTPLLSNLTIIGQYTPTDLIDFLTRSGGGGTLDLDVLTLGPGYMKDEAIIQVLEALPFLRRFILDADIGTARQPTSRVVTEKLLNRLTILPDSDALLPTLEHLTLKTTINFPNPTALLDVLSSRWEVWTEELYGIPVARLGSADLHFCGQRSTLNVETIDELRELRADGLNVTLRQDRDDIPLDSSPAYDFM